MTAGRRPGAGSNIRIRNLGVAIVLSMGAFPSYVREEFCRDRVTVVAVVDHDPVRKRADHAQPPSCALYGTAVSMTCHTAVTVLLILGVPDVAIDSIMGWEPGGAARMRARYMHVTGTMLRKVAQQVGDAL